MAKPASEIRPAPLLTVTLRLPEADIEDIDRLAKKLELSRSQMLRNICLVGLDQLRGLDKIGVLSAATSIRSLASWIKEKGLLPDQSDKDSKMEK
jgi:hypothetical protein